MTSETPQSGFSIVCDMEEDCHAVGKWANVLIHCGLSSGMIPPEAIYVIGDALHAIGQRLAEDHERAHTALVAEKAKPRGRACA